MSARLSRKGNFTGQAYHSMLHATQLKDRSATIEHARLLWKDGHHRKAIQILEGAIAANQFMPPVSSPVDGNSIPMESDREQHHNILAARVSSPPISHDRSFLTKGHCVMFVGTSVARKVDR